VDGVARTASIPLSAAGLRLAFDSSPVRAAVFAGPDHALLYQNPASVRRCGERPIGVGVAEAFPEYPTWAATLDAALQAAVADGYGETPLRRAPGREPGPIGAAPSGGPGGTVSPLFNDAGEPWGLLWHCAVDEHRSNPSGEHYRVAMAMAEATAELARSLDRDQVIATITRLAAEVFHGWCLLNLWQPDGSLQRVGGSHHDPARQHLIDQITRVPRVSGRTQGGESIAVRVARTGQMAMGLLDPDFLEPVASSADHARVLHALEPRSYLVVPIQLGPRRLGALSVLRSEKSRPFSAADREVMERFAEQAAVALSHALDYDEQRQAVLALQQNSLRAAPPTVPGLELAVRYSAAGRGANVGGDWYDVFLLDDGSVGVAVGDVQGHDLGAAALMSQIRSVVHSHARAGLPPALVLEHANRFVSELQDDRLITMTYLQLHPSERLMVYARAGHMPIVQVGPEADDIYEGRGGLPLGVRADARWMEHTVHLPPGGITAVFTDGLVESPSRSYGEGIDVLLATLGAVGQAPLARVAEALVGDDGSPRDDDVAVVLFRLTDTGPVSRRIARCLPPVAASAGIARYFLSDILRQWHLDDLVEVSELLTSELVTNATRHSDGPIELRVQLDQRLRVEVYDDSHRLPAPGEPADEDTSGRGLRLVGALATNWGFNPEGAGKAVWFELDLPGEPTQ
jgi:serine phosphatase RsbU (regulator of sigma subunit)/anti-sigma regulatory factor (Ser/Thr protein kinase)